MMVCLKDPDDRHLSNRAAPAFCSPSRRLGLVNLALWSGPGERAGIGALEPSPPRVDWCVDAPIPDVERVGRVLERHSNRRSFAITVLTARKEHVRKLSVDRAISTMSGRY